MKRTRHAKLLLQSNFFISLCVAALVTLALALVVLTMSPSSTVSAHTQTTSYNWYFKPREDGMQPIVADNASFVSKYDNVYYLGDPADQSIYLTFDAGYENGNTSLILDALKEEGVPAAFFVTGHYVKTNPDLIKRMNDEGHLVCNHTLGHADLSALSDPGLFSGEVDGLAEVYYEITGSEMPRYLRPPEGKYSELSLQMADELGYKMVFWSFAYKDWLNDAQPAPEQAKKTILARTHPGAIILLHSTSATNASIMSDLIHLWQDNGYTIKSLDEFSAAAAS